MVDDEGIQEKENLEFLKKPTFSSDDEEEEHELNEINHIKSFSTTMSPYIEQYQRTFIRKRKSKYYIQYWKNFLKYDIISFKESRKRFSFRKQTIYTSKNHRIVHYKVYMSYFIVTVKILNAPDNYSFPFQQQINKGAFGTVYAVNELGQQYAVKEISLVSNEVNIIQEAVRQYALLKLMAALQCGPVIRFLFGFDIVVTKRHVYFSTERCVSLSQFIPTLSTNQVFNKKFQELEMSLLLMHSLYICHFDIKSANIMYSPALKKLVFIDFGFSEYTSSQIGYMKESVAKGSFHYCSEEMKNLLISEKRKGFIDVYYNDYYGLKKTKESLKEIYKDQTYQNEDLKNQNHTLRNNTNKSSQLSSNGNHLNFEINHFKDIQPRVGKLFDPQNIAESLQESDYLTVNICFLMSESRITQFVQFLKCEHINLYKKIDDILEKVYWVFLQVQLTSKLQTAYQNFKKVLSKNIKLSLNSKLIIETILDPYFFNSKSKNDEKNSPNQSKEINHIQSRYLNQEQKKSIMKRYKSFLELNEKQNTISVGREDKIKKLKKQKSIVAHYQSPKLLTPIEIDKQSLNSSLKKKILLFSSTGQQGLSKSFMIQFLQNLSDKKILAILLKIKSQVSDNGSRNQQNLSDFPIFTFQNYTKGIYFFKECFSIGDFEMHISEYIDDKISEVQFFEFILKIFLDLLVAIVEEFNVEKATQFLIGSNKQYPKKSHHSKLKARKLPSQNQKRRNTHQKDIQQETNSIIISKSENRNARKTTIDNFILCLQNLLSYLSFYLRSLNYSSKRKIIDPLLEIVSSKMIEILRYKQFVEDINLCSVYLCAVFTLLLEKSLLFIYEAGIRMLIEAENRGDYVGLSFYYDKIFNMEKYNKSTPFSHQIMKKILEINDIILLGKQACYLLIYKTSLPSYLCEKYHLLKKIQTITHILLFQKFRMLESHAKELKNFLFEIHFNQLTMENMYSRMLQSQNYIFCMQNWAEGQNAVNALVSLYKSVNNDRLVRKIKNKCEAKQSMKKKTGPFNSVHLTNKKEIESNFQNSKSETKQNPCLLQFKRILRQGLFETNYKIKLLKLRKIIYEFLSDSTYDHNSHIVLCLQAYEKVVNEAETRIFQKIVILRSLQLNAPIFSFLNQMNLTNPMGFMEKIWTEDKFTQIKVQKNLTYHTNQNQFWDQISKFQILEHRIQFISLLLRCTNYINDLSIVREAWVNCQLKIRKLFQGQQNKCLPYLEVVSRMKQFEYRCLVKSNNATVQEISEAQKILLKSLGDYLDQFTSNNELYVHEIKHSRFGIDTLVKSLRGNIVLEEQSFSYKKTKQRLIECFIVFAENGQIYQFFQNDPTLKIFLQHIIDFAIDEIHEKSSEKTENLLSLQIGQIKITQFFTGPNMLKIIFHEIGKFVEPYFCWNYAKKFEQISQMLMSSIKRFFKSMKEKSNNKNEQVTFSLMVFLIFEDLLQLSKMNYHQYLVLTIFLLLSNLTTFLNENEKCIFPVCCSEQCEHNFIRSVCRKAFTNLCQEIILKDTVPSIMDLNRIALKIASNLTINKNSTQSILFNQVKLFRNTGNSSNLLDPIHKQVNYLTKDQRKNLKKVEFANNQLQKRLRGICQQLLRKNQQTINENIFLAKIKQKIIQRIVICV